MAAFTLVLAGCDHSSHEARMHAGSALRAVPIVLADGTRPASLPWALRRVHTLPVLGAREVSARTAARLCPSASGPGPKGRFAGSWLTPEGLTAQYALAGGSLTACEAIRSRGRWVVCGRAFARSGDPAQVELSGAGLLVACDDLAGLRPFLWVAVPAHAAWALVRQRGYWTAYRTGGRTLVRVSAPDNRVRIAFADVHGRMLRERKIRGYVAG